MIALSASTWAGDGSQMGRMKADREGQAAKIYPATLSSAHIPTLPWLATLVCIPGDYPPLSAAEPRGCWCLGEAISSVLAKTGVFERGLSGRMRRRYAEPLRYLSLSPLYGLLHNWE